MSVLDLHLGANLSIPVYRLAVAAPLPGLERPRLNLKATYTQMFFSMLVQGLRAQVAQDCGPGLGVSVPGAVST